MTLITSSFKYNLKEEKLMRTKYKENDYRHEIRKQSNILTYDLTVH